MHAADAIAPGGSISSKSLPVVGDDEPDGVTVDVEDHIHPGRLGVLDDILQSLLGDSEQGGLDVSGKPAWLDLELRGNAG
jgi:hypothetical protein